MPNEYTMKRIQDGDYLFQHNITVNRGQDWVQHPEMVAAQTAFLTLWVDLEEIPEDLQKLVKGTGFKMSTFRPCVRYAQDRDAEVLIAVTELDLECERLGFKALHGKRYDVYRGMIEDRLHVPRAQHIGDEAWLANAHPLYLVKETIQAIYERYYMELVEENLQSFIHRNKVSEWRKTLGIDTVYQKPERKEEDTSKALVKYTGGRGDKGGRGGGSVGRAEGGSFRGWK